MMAEASFHRVSRVRSVDGRDRRRRREAISAQAQRLNNEYVA